MFAASDLTFSYYQDKLHCACCFVIIHTGDSMESSTITLGEFNPYREGDTLSLTAIDNRWYIKLLYFIFMGEIPVKTQTFTVTGTFYDTIDIINPLELEQDMPLIKSKSKKAVGKNIKMEIASGKPRKQAIAIALEVQRKAKRKKK